MSNILLNQSYNMANNDGFYVVTDDSLISATNTELVYRSPENTVQHYIGIFEGDFNTGLTGGTLTGFTEYEGDGSTLIWSAENITVPYDVYFSYADANNSLGLRQYALSGDDTITGSAQDDTLIGAEGADEIRAGSGNDWIQLDGGDDIFANGNAGNDTLWGGAGNDARILGGKDNDFVAGDGGDDFLNGNKGNDTVYGGTGNDTLHGGQDGDILYGETGNDILYGDKGNDTIIGGTGADIFVFSNDSGVDTITDFESGDVLQIKININESAIIDFTTLQNNVTTTDSGLSIDLGSGNSLELTGLSVLESSDVVFF